MIKKRCKTCKKTFFCLTNRAKFCNRKCFGVYMSKRLANNTYTRGMKGLWHWSEESKQKMSDYWSMHPTKAMLGKKHSAETREKMRNSAMSRMIKRPDTIPWKAFIRSRKGKKPIRKDIRNDPLYKQWVVRVKRRDNNVCQLKDENCSGYNVVHHIFKWKEFPEFRYEQWNGITLCQYHHKKQHLSS